MTLGLLIGSAVLLAAFVAIERRVAHPLLPLRVVADRDRGGAFLAIATASAGIFGVLLFLTFYLQNTKGLTALETGLAFLPMSFTIAPTVALASTRLLPRTGPRPLVPAGMLTAALGMALLTRIGIDTAYATHVLPSLMLIGAGFGMILGASFATATTGVPAHDSGVASAMVSTSQQIGGSIGIALLSTFAVVGDDRVRDRPRPSARGDPAGGRRGLHDRLLVGGGHVRGGRAGHRRAPALGRAPRSRPRRGRSPSRRTRKGPTMQTAPPTPCQAEPDHRRDALEVADLAGGAAVMLLPLLLLAVPGIAAFVVLPALVLLAVVAAPVAVAGAVVVPTYLLIRAVSRRPRHRRRTGSPQPVGLAGRAG